MRPKARSVGNAGHGKVSSVASADVDLSAESILAQLEKILTSSSFARSERLSRFMRFAVDQTIQGHGEHLKEYLVGMEVFDRHHSYDPRVDPIVRVEAARLRSKLKAYYQNEGRDDSIVIDFSKGSYVPTFQEREPSTITAIPDRPPARAPTDWKTFALAAALMLTAITAFWAVSLHRQNLTLQKGIETTKARGPDPAFAPIWKPFFDSEAQTFIVFGSPMFFANDSTNTFVRRGNLNDATSFLADPNFKTMQEDYGPLSGPLYFYAEMGDALGLQRLTAFFGRSGGTLTALPAHLASWDTIKEGNIIFLGSQRMDPLIRRLPVRLDFEWGPDNNIHNRNPQPGEQKDYLTTSNRDSVTYAVIASFPGLRPNREILLLVSHSSPGAMAAVEYVTHSESVRTMKAKLGLTGSGERMYYQMLLSVLVHNNVPVKTEYVAHHLILAPPDKQ